MRKKPMIITLSVIAVLLILFLTFALWAASFVMTGRRQSIDDALKWQSEHYDVSFYDRLEKIDYTVSGEDGYVLNVEFLKNPEDTTKYMILTHGYTDNHIGSLKYVSMYLDLGFNCIIYDLRGHGENEPTFTTYGIKESYDLNCIIKDTRARYPDISVLGLHGESLGSGTTITALKYKPEVDFAVADCGFSDIENVLRNLYKTYNVPGVLFDIADFGAKIRYHYSLKKMRPIDSLDDNTIPILFIHGSDDTLILPRNSEDMAQRTKGYSEVCIIEGAGHAVSIFTDPETYKDRVSSFIGTVLTP